MPGIIEGQRAVFGREEIEHLMPEVTIAAGAVQVEEQFALAHIWYHVGQGGAAGVEIVHRIAVNFHVFGWHSPSRRKKASP